MAKAVLARVAAPTLLIVGERDETVLAWNRESFAELRCEKRLEIVPAATHLFEESGTLEEVARLAAEWFRRWLPRVAVIACAMRGCPGLGRLVGNCKRVSSSPWTAASSGFHIRVLVMMGIGRSRPELWVEPFTSVGDFERPLLRKTNKFLP